MKTILVMPDGNWLSHTSRPFEITKHLANLDYKIIFASDGEYMKLPRNYGFEVKSIKTIDPDHVLRCSRSGRANWYDYKLIKDCVEADLAMFDVVNPDLVLTDFRLPLSISCELANIPLAVVLNAAWTNFSTVRINAPEHLKATQIVGKRIANMLVPWVKQWIISQDNRPFNRYRRKMGLKKRLNIYDTWKGDLNLMVDIPEFTPTENLPNNFRYIGPIVWEPDLPLPEWYDQLNEKKQTIYFSMGSTGYARFFDQAVDIFGNSEYQCILTTAGMADIHDFPDNFFVVDYAPGSKILERSDLVVCHGGNGTIYQAMAQGVPIIGIPTMHDQEYNLDRVEALGIGIHLSELKFKPEHLSAAVEKIFSDTQFRRNALRCKEVVSSYDGPKKGAELIDAFFGKH